MWCRSGGGRPCRLPGRVVRKALVFVARGVKVGFCPFGADAKSVASLFQCGDAGVGGRGELLECALVVGANTGDLVGRGGLGRPLGRWRRPRPGGLGRRPLGLFQARVASATWRAASRGGADVAVRCRGPA